MKQQTAVHIVASRQTATATSILRVLLAAAGKDIRLKADGVSKPRLGQCSRLPTSHQREIRLRPRSLKFRPCVNSLEQNNNNSFSTLMTVQPFMTFCLRVCVCVSRYCGMNIRFRSENSKMSGFGKNH